MGEILLTRKKAQECPALLRAIIANCAAQHGIPCLQCIQQRALRRLSRDLKDDLARDLRQSSQMRREYDANFRAAPAHGSVWTSTDITAGRLCTIADQLSPPSGDA